MYMKGTVMAAVALKYDHSNYTITTSTAGSKVIHCSISGVADTPVSSSNTYTFADYWSYNGGSGQWAITATAANETFTIPNAPNQVQSIVGKFTNDAVVVGHSHDCYQITRNADGTLTVTDTVYGTLHNTVINGIATLKFSDGLTYDTASAKMTMVGTGGNDTLTVVAGAQVVDGGAGINTAVFAKAQSAYTVTSGVHGAFTIVDNATHLPVTTNNIQVLKFSDGAKVGEVDGTAANNTLQITANTRLVEGMGGTDTAVFPNYSGWYSIAKNAAGGIDVTDTHATGTVVHLDGIATLKFSDGLSYDTATATMVLLGTAGNDTLTVGAGVQKVDGGAGINTAVFAKAQSAYTVTSGVHGAFSIVDNATHLTVTANNIQVLKFSDGTRVGEVDGTAGNDRLIVTANTRLVEGMGGTDTAVFANTDTSYGIAKNAAGGIDVTDIHATGTVVHLDGIGKIAFANSVYDVASGTYTATVAASSGSSSPAVANSGTIYHAPVLPAPSGAGDIVAVHLENNTAAAIAPRTVTFGQVFVDGDLPAGTHLVAMVNGQPVAVQVDARTHYPDGSVQQATLSVAAPSIPANSAIDVMLERGSGAAASQAPVDPHNFVAHGYDTDVTLTLHNANGSSSVQTIDAAQALTKALVNGTATTVLSGPLAGEVQVDVPVNGSLHVVLNIRGNADGTFSTDVQACNDHIFSADAKPYTYDVSIASHGQTLFSQTGITQAPMQEWHHDVWSNATGVAVAPADFVAFDVAYLERTGAVMGYDTSTGVTATSVGTDTAAIAAGNHSLLGNAEVVQYEPMTGGRSDIGISNAWSAGWLVSQNQAAEQVMLANANAAGSEPIHAANADGSMITIANHPDLWLDSRNFSAVPPTNNFGTIETETGWALDVAHISELTFMAAITQGSEYYVQQVQAQADYDLLSYNPGYRGGSGGIAMGQIRGIAWTIRDLADAAYVSADGDPLKAYYTQALEANIKNLITEYVGTAKGAAEGQLQGYVFDSDHPDLTAPWQQDYLVLAMAHAAELGYAGAAQFMGWENSFIAGRFLNGANGYNPLNGTGYWLNIADPNSDLSHYNPTGPGAPGVALFQTWAQVYNSTYAGQAAPTQLAGYPDDPGGGYAAIAKASLSAEWDVTHNPDDLAAYAYLTSLTPSLIGSAAGYASSQTWDITPTLSDGHHLLNAEVYYGDGGTTTAGTPDGLLAAHSGNNVLNAGSGASILIAGSGNDVLHGGAGNDFLFGGSGTARLDGGAGTNYLKGGSGADTFAFQVGTAAHDTVVAFKPGFDTLEISTGGNGMTALDVISHATADAAGNAVLHLSLNHDVTLQNVHVTSLDSHWLHMV